MPIIKHVKQFGYVQIANTTAQAAQSGIISYEAAGILLDLSSRPDNWIIYKKFYRNKYAGELVVNRIFKELRSAGFLYIKEIRNKAGQIEDRVWYVSDVCLSSEEWDKALDYLNSCNDQIEVASSWAKQDLQIHNITNKDFKDLKKTYSLSVGTDDENDEIVKSEKKEKKKEVIPYDEIVALYNKIVAHDYSIAPFCKIVTAMRKKLMAARWRKELPTIESWEKFFLLVSESDWLMGKVASKSSGETCRSTTLDWLLKESNCVKVLEFNYDNNRKWQ